MLDMKLFRDNPEVIRRDHERRGISQEPIDEVIRLDNEWKNSLHTMEASRRKRNIAAKEIAEAKKQGDQNKVNTILSQVKDLGLEIDQLDARAKIYFSNAIISECVYRTYCMMTYHQVMMSKEIQ